MSEPADLFQPTVQDYAPTVPPPGERPWRSGSARYVGFFGGPLAATMHALANFDRLGAADSDEARRARKLGYGLTAALIVAQVVAVFWLVEDVESMRAQRRNIRYIAQLGGLGVGHFLAGLLAGAERRWIQRLGATDESFDGAFWPGVKHAFGWGFVGAIPVIAATALAIYL